MTRQLDTDISLRSREAAPPNGAAMVQAASALLAELERSLEASQRALLRRDLEGLERGTGEQIDLRQSFKTLWSENSARQLDPVLAAGLRAAQWRVLYLGRVQAALLTRARRSLRIVSHRLAGPEASYAQPDFEPRRSRAQSGASGHGKKDENHRIKMETEENKKEEAGPCRV